MLYKVSIISAHTFTNVKILIREKRCIPFFKLFPEETIDEYPKSMAE